MSRPISSSSRRVVDHDAFAAGAVATAFVDRTRRSCWHRRRRPMTGAWRSPPCGCCAGSGGTTVAAAAAAGADPHSPWHRVDGWRLAPHGWHRRCAGPARGGRDRRKAEAGLGGCDRRARAADRPVELPMMAGLEVRARWSARRRGRGASASRTLFTPARPHFSVQRHSTCWPSRGEDETGDVLDRADAAAIVRQLIAARDRWPRRAASRALEQKTEQHDRRAGRRPRRRVALRRRRPGGGGGGPARFRGRPSRAARGLSEGI